MAKNTAVKETEPVVKKLPPGLKRIKATREEVATLEKEGKLVGCDFNEGIAIVKA